MLILSDLLDDKQKQNELEAKIEELENFISQKE